MPITLRSAIIVRGNAILSSLNKKKGVEHSTHRPLSFYCAYAGIAAGAGVAVAGARPAAA